MDHKILLAQAPTPLGTFKGIGPLGDFFLSKDYPSSAINLFAKILSNSIGVMTIIAFIWFMFVLFIGAIGLIGAGGDKQRTQNSQKQITNGLIGLVIVISAIFFIKIIGVLFGIDFLNIAEPISKIWQ